MKLEEAIPLMMATLHEMPEEWISEECHRAFTKMGSEAVIAQFANDYATSEWFERMSIACTLEDIHSDRSRSSLPRLLETRGRPGNQVDPASIDPLQLLLTEGIEPARQFILKTPLDPDVLEVRSTLLTACKLMGERFPEFDAWLEDSKNDQEFRRKWHEEHPLPEDEDERGSRNEDLEEDEYEEPEPATIVRRTERIGRMIPVLAAAGKSSRNVLRQEPSREETDSFHASAMSGVAPGKVNSEVPHRHRGLLRP